jgi:transposase
LKPKECKMSKQKGVEKKVREIRRKTRKRYSAEEKIRIVLEGLRGEESIAAHCRRRGSVATCITAGARSWWLIFP